MKFLKFFFLNLKLSPGDGFKELRFKVRNRFHNESTDIVKKVEVISLGPTYCKVDFLSSVSQTNRTRLRITSDHPRKLFYRIQGDVKATTLFTEFDQSVIVPVEMYEKLENESNQREIRVIVRDEANNYCPQTLKGNVRIDPDYSPSSTQILDNVSWVDEESIVLELGFDHFEGENIQMMISGTLDDGELSDLGKHSETEYR